MRAMKLSAPVFWLGLAGSVVVLYLLLVLLVWGFQEWLIFPGRYTHAKSAFVTTPGPDEELIPLTTSNGQKTFALFGKAQRPDGSPDPDAARRPTLLWFYGNAMCLKHCDWNLREFRPLGFNVCIPEYLGYGMAEGAPSEAGCYAVADAAYAYLLSRPDIAHDRIISSGWSLGGAVAIDLAARKQAEGHLAGLMTFCTFTSMAEAGSSSYPFLPVRTLLRYKFDSAQKLRQLKMPLLIAHGKKDRVIPFAMSEELTRIAQANGAQATRLIIPEAGHNDFFSTGGEEVLEAMRGFGTRLEPQPVR